MILSASRAAGCWASTSMYGTIEDAPAPKMLVIASWGYLNVVHSCWQLRGRLRITKTRAETRLLPHTTVHTYDMYVPYRHHLLYVGTPVCRPAFTYRSVFMCHPGHIPVRVLGSWVRGSTRRHRKSREPGRGGQVVMSAPPPDVSARCEVVMRRRQGVTRECAPFLVPSQLPQSSAQSQICKVKF